MKIFDYLFNHFQPYNKNINNLFTYERILVRLHNQNLKAYERNVPKKHLSN